MSSKPIPQGSLVLLWAGEDPAVHAVLLEELGAAEIPFSDKSLGDDEVAPTADPLPIDWKPRFGFEVAVLSTDLAEAQEVLEKLLAEEPAIFREPLALPQDPWKAPLPQIQIAASSQSAAGQPSAPLHHPQDSCPKTESPLLPTLPATPRVPPDPPRPTARPANLAELVSRT